MVQSLQNTCDIWLRGKNVLNNVLNNMTVLLHWASKVKLSSTSCLVCKVHRFFGLGKKEIILEDKSGDALILL